MMQQPPYSPDLVPCDFFLFPKLKRPMKGRRYATLDEIKTASKEELKKILKNDFLKCFEDWKNRWHKCIISHGDYFEGDKIGLVKTINDILNSTGFSYLINCTDKDFLQDELPLIIRTAIDQSIQGDWARINNTKLYPHYRNLKKTSLPEGYLSDNLPFIFKRHIAQLRVLYTFFRENHKNIFGEAELLLNRQDHYSTRITTVKVDRMNQDDKEARVQEIGEFPNNDHGPTTSPPHLSTIILQLATILERLQPLHPRDLDLPAFDENPRGLIPRQDRHNLRKFFAAKAQHYNTLEEYFRTKTTLGMQLNLPRPVIIEALTEGLPTGDQRLVRVVPPKSLSEWYELTSRVRGNFSPQPPRGPDNPPRMEGPYHNTPRPPPRAQNYAAIPPSPCKFCQGQHWHSQCQQRPASNAQRGQAYHASHHRQGPFNQANNGRQTTSSTTPDAPTTSDTSPKQLTYAQTELSNPNCPTQFDFLLHNYQHIFSENKFDVPTLNIPPVKINTTSDKIITLRPYRVPYCDLKEIQNQVAEMLKYNIIEKSYSPFASPVTLVTKRDKTKRFCIDYRKLNDIIQPDIHPPPVIDSVLDKLSRAKIFSSVDIASAYWQVEIAPESRPLLAFVTPDGQYQWTRLPFGLRNSPQIYERSISQIIQKHNLQHIEHYFDDFIIFSESTEEHIQHLTKFFEVCQAENIRLNYNKCEFFKTSIEFLGYTISAGTYTPQLRNLDTINAIKPPYNQKSLQSFLGAINVYHKFIPNYARLRTPLNNLLKKNVNWHWSDACQQAFETLKKCLTTQPVLHLFQEGLPCQLYCDASTQGIAGILKQVHPNNQIHPVQFYSRALRPHEQNYNISELECLAIIESVEKFRIYLTGTKFTIFSDHHALQWLKSIKNPAGRLFRWSLRLSTYDYEIRYIKGTLQYEADLLSRNPFCGLLDADTIKIHQNNTPTHPHITQDTNGLHTITRKGVTKILMPEKIRNTLLNKVHLEYNHPGISQMSRLVSGQYHWAGMSRDIKNHVNSCTTCQLTKHPKGPTYGELGQTPPATKPFDLISIDTVSGFAKYGNSKTHLHVIVDHMTRYAWTFPSKSTSTLTYIQAIKKVLVYGSPKRLLSDRAPAFTSEKFRRFLVAHGIQPLNTTSNNPQANGLCERLNSTITGKLRLLHLENPKTSWTKLDNKVTQVYNNTPHSVTGFPPSYLLFGIIPTELSNHINPYPPIDIARQQAYQRTQLKHDKDKQKFDLNHKTPNFEIGDLVLVKVYHHPNTGKLTPYFTGPYTILEVISPNVVKINRPNQLLNKEHDTIHVNKLRPYTESVPHIAPPTMQAYFAQPKDNDSFPFRHLSPDLFQEYQLPIKPTSSQPLPPLTPNLFTLIQIDPTSSNNFSPVPHLQFNHEPTPSQVTTSTLQHQWLSPQLISLIKHIGYNMKTFLIFHLILLIYTLTMPFSTVPLITLIYIGIYAQETDRLFQLQEAIFQLLTIISQDKPVVGETGYLGTTWSLDPEWWPDSWSVLCRQIIARFLICSELLLGSALQLDSVIATLAVSLNITTGGEENQPFYRTVRLTKSCNCNYHSISTFLQPGIEVGVYKNIKNGSNRRGFLEILEVNKDEEQFQKTAELLNKLFPDDKDNEDTTFHKNIRNYTLGFHNKENIIITPNEVNRIIDELNSKKMPGIDNISNNMIKHTKQLIVPILVKLFQKCLDLNYYPNEWKKSEVIIIPEPVGRRTKRWPLCLFSNFLDVVAINSAVIYKAVKQDGGMARKDFIKQLALQLMRDALNMRNQAKNLSRDLQVLIQKHAGTSSLEGVCKAMGVGAVNTTAWRPQSNGAVERLNRTVIESLRRCTAGNNWDTTLPMVALAIRTTVHSSTGFTPAKLVFGHELRLPQPFQEGELNPVCEDSITEMAAFYERELVEEVERAREVVRQTYLKEQQEARAEFEARELRTFETGDLALVKRMHETKGRHKFEPRYRGPYEVLQRTGDTVYLLKELETGHLDKIHIDRMKAYHAPVKTYPTGDGNTQEQIDSITDDEDHWVHPTYPIYSHRTVEPVEPRETATLRNPPEVVNRAIGGNVDGPGIRRSTRVKRPTD
ncbi:hypothetical protein LAZ67_7001321 [Cordylochernes scorpioides]|uniref:RNA-directed DNA polymerase n=1 Tax=Cordylochernes scorpioides TaxID=51811 RepID=A0ABY6KM70_9ARAC|nr:hypothetical protein LAZ67_7001321 [Cordylochernes scorpioides]